MANETTETRSYGPVATTTRSKGPKKSKKKSKKKARVSPRLHDAVEDGY